MKRLTRMLLMMLVLTVGASLTSCGDIVIGSPDNPAPKPTPTPTPTPEPELTPEEIVEQAKQLLKDAQQDGALVSTTFTYNGKAYTAAFKREDGVFVLQAALADGLDATLQEVEGKTAGDPHNLIFTILDTATGGTLLQVFIDAAEDTVEVQTVGEGIAFIGVDVNGETVTMNPSTDPGASDGTVCVTGASLDQTALSLGIGRTATLTCTLTPANATDKTVTWTSGDETVATVDADGKVTAVAKGKTVITAEPKGQNPHFKIAAPTCEVTVDPVAVTGITLDKTTLALIVDGDPATLTATVTPEDATDKTVVWTTSDASVATVANGVVTAVMNGTATITATATNGTEDTTDDKEATCTVTVSPNSIIASATGFSGKYDGAAHGISVTVSSPSGATVKYGTAEGTYGLTASPTYTNAGTYTVYYQVTKEGYSTMTGSAQVAIAKADASISFAQATVEKIIGAAAFTNALTKTGDGTVTYASDNTAVAAVNSTTGQVTIAGIGSATITATVADGANYTYATKTASYTLTVNPIAVTGITLSKTSLELTEGDTFTLTATVAPTDATNEDVTWKSDKPAVASVDENGKVTAVAAGTAKITVTTTDGGKTADCTVKVLPKTGGSLANMDDPEDI